MGSSAKFTWLDGWRGLVIGPLCVVLAAAAMLLWDGDTGARPLLGLLREESRVTDELRALEARRAVLSEQAVLLRDDALEIEAAARETLGMVRPGETVIRLSEPN